MNGRQAAKAAAKRVAELEYVNSLQARDIKMHNEAMQHVISGGSPCDWCEDLEECKLEARGGKGCTEWWLKYPKGEAVSSDQSEGLVPDGSEGGTGIKIDSCAD